MKTLTNFQNTILIVLSVFMFSCKKYENTAADNLANSNDYKTYIIKKGDTKSHVFPRLYSGMIYNYTCDVIFIDVSYDTQQSTDEWNYLCGFTFGRVSKDKNSLGYEWKYDDKTSGIKAMPAVTMNESKIDKGISATDLIMGKEYTFAMYDNLDGSWMFNIIDKSTKKIISKNSISIWQGAISDKGFNLQPELSSSKNKAIRIAIRKH